MKRLILMGLLALGALACTVGHARAACYYPCGWYVPKGSYWVRWHGLREVWQPPTPTEWIGPGGPGPVCYPPAGWPEIPFQPLGSLPPLGGYENVWFYGKQSGQGPSVKQLIPDAWGAPGYPGYLP